MKKMNYKVLLLSAVLAAAALAGCSGGSGSSSSAPAAQAPASQTSSEQSAADSPSEASEGASSKAEESSTPTGEPVDASWFNDAVFVGDSVTLKLSYYADNGSLGDAQFLCQGSLSYYNAQWDLDHEDEVHPTIDGVKYQVQDGIAELGSKKVFVMLGMNDIGLNGVDQSIVNMIALTDKIMEKNPGVTLYIESVTPMLVESQLSGLNNTSIKEFDEKLKTVCEEKGYHYLDIASAVDDGEGNLVPEYCGDPDAMGLHFSDEGCDQWVTYLKSHVS